MHVCDMAAQFLHAPPPVPHASSAVPGTHMVPMNRQPVQQLPATHVPIWPPSVQAPASRSVCTHIPDASQLSVVHGFPSSQSPAARHCTHWRLALQNGVAPPQPAWSPGSHAAQTPETH